MNAFRELGHDCGVALARWKGYGHCIVLFAAEAFPLVSRVCRAICCWQEGRVCLGTVAICQLHWVGDPFDGCVLFSSLDLTHKKPKRALA